MPEDKDGGMTPV